MRTTQQTVLSILLAFLMPGYAAGQASSSGVTSTSHAGVIKGVVTSTSGKPLKKADVTLVNLLTEEKMQTQTDKSGRFQFLRLFSGKYRVEVTTKRGETAADELSLEDGETITRKLIARQHG